MVVGVCFDSHFRHIETVHFILLAAAKREDEVGNLEPDQTCDEDEHDVGNDANGRGAQLAPVCVVASEERSENPCDPLIRPAAAREFSVFFSASGVPSLRTVCIAPSLRRVCTPPQPAP